MKWLMTLYTAVLFFVLSPGILLSLPPKGSKFVVAMVHAVVFAAVFHFTHKLVWKATGGVARMPMPVEGFKRR